MSYKAVYLNENGFSAIEKAYSPEILLKIPAPQLAFSSKAILSEPSKFSDVKYIFSTWGMPVLSEEQISKCFPSLIAVFYAAGSVRYFAMDYLSNGVKVFSSWGANAVPVAEFTVAQIVLANKGYFQTVRKLTGSQENYISASALARVHKGNFGVSVGIIGAGMIGSHVARLLKSYDLKLFVYDPYLTDDRAMELGVEKIGLPELFANCKVISNHLPDLPETRGMLDYSLFKLMSKDVCFINTARGAQVIEADLVRILTENPSITSLLDVTEPEPPQTGHPFYSLSNCFLTPHISGSMNDEVLRMGVYMYEEYSKFISGKPVNFEVTIEMLKTMA